VFIRPRIIGGKTPSGIVYTRSRAPKVFATVIGIAEQNPLFKAGEVLPGDLVMFVRHSEEIVGYDRSVLAFDDPNWTDYRHEIAAVHYSSLECVLPYRERLPI
jgi:hypothetical protein